MTTRAYNISELGLMRLEDLMREIQKIAERQVFEAGGTMPHRFGSLFYDLHQPGAQLTIPIKSYAASVVERFAETLPLNIKMSNWEALYSSATQSIFFYEKNAYFPSGMFSLPCIFNPFTGLLNPDGTQRTSATREEIEQWKKEG